MVGGREIHLLDLSTPCLVGPHCLSGALPPLYTWVVAPLGNLGEPLVKPDSILCHVTLHQRPVWGETRASVDQVHHNGSNGGHTRAQTQPRAGDRWQHWQLRLQQARISMRKQILGDADIKEEAWQAGTQIPAEGITVPRRKGPKWTKQ